MNIPDQVKQYQEHRLNAEKHEQQLKEAASTFYRQLLSVSEFANTLPYDVAYRKKKLQSIISSTLQSIELITGELQRLGIDCDLQIQALISKHTIQKLREEQENAKSTNTGLAGRFGNQREPDDS